MPEYSLNYKLQPQTLQICLFYFSSSEECVFPVAPQQIQHLSAQLLPGAQH